MKLLKIYNTLSFLAVILLNASSCSKNKETIITPPDKGDPGQEVVYKSHQIDSIKEDLEKNGYTVNHYTINQDSSTVTFKYSETLDGADEYGMMDFGISPMDVQNPRTLFPGRLFNGQEFLKTSNYAFNPEIAQIKSSSVKAVVTAGNGMHLSDYTIPASAIYPDYINPLAQIIKQTDSTLLVKNRSKPQRVSGNYTKVQDIKNKLLFNNSDRLLLNMDLAPRFVDDAVSDNEDVRATSGTYVFFRQDYVHVNLDSSSFKLDVSAIGNDSAFYAQYNPVYVSSVICGNYGLIVFESMDEASSVLDAVNTLLEQDASALTSSQKLILNSAKSRTFYRSYVRWYKGMSGTEKLTQIKKFFDQGNSSSINLDDASLTTYIKIRRVRDNLPFDGSTYTYTKEFKLE